MPNKTLLCDARHATTLPEFYQVLAYSTGWGTRPAPRNLDGLADLLREAKIQTIVLEHCRLSISDYKTVADVCRDLDIRVITP